MEMGMGFQEELHDIVIVGGGICGLATALALHRKGFNSVVLEKSNTLRAAGAAIGIYMNGWHALDQLGVGAELRKKAIPLSEIQDIQLHKDTVQITPCRKEALRCLKRRDLIEILADSLPTRSIRFGCQIVAVETDALTLFPILHVDDGSIIKAKILIGCDGSNSVIARSLGLKAPELFPYSVVRGFTSYPNGHNYGSYFLRLSNYPTIWGRIPIDEQLVHWFVGWQTAPEDSEVQKDSKHIKELARELLKDFPLEVMEMVELCCPESLSLVQTRYRAPWHLLFGSVQKGTTTVAGDAMHVMGPFLGQGGAVALEDAVVLARCLAQELQAGTEGQVSTQELQKRVGTALKRYVRERMPRVMRLSVQSYLVGLMISASSRVVKRLSLAILNAFFGGVSLSHTQYDCGSL